MSEYTEITEQEANDLLVGAGVLRLGTTLAFCAYEGAGVEAVGAFGMWFICSRQLIEDGGTLPTLKGYDVAGFTDTLNYMLNYPNV